MVHLFAGRLTSMQKALCLTVFAVAAWADDRPAALRGLDPVLLTRGVETAGSATLTRDRKGYRYQFASEANRAAFDRMPEQFEIQMDGACARMGPASGAGSADRFLVHEGRIYVFASEGCRRTFSQDPANHIEWPEPKPNPPAELRRRGAELLEQATAHAGTATFQGMRWEMTLGTAKPEEKPVREVCEWSAPGQWRREMHYAGWGAEIIEVGGGKAERTTPSGKSGMRPAEQAALAEAAFEEPLLLLRHARPPETVVWHGGATTVAGGYAETVHVWRNGRRYTLGLGSGGRVLTYEFRGRGARSWLANIRLVFSDHREIDGVLVAHTAEAYSEGVAWPQRSYRLDRAAVRR